MTEIRTSLADSSIAEEEELDLVGLHAALTSSKHKKHNRLTNCKGSKIAYTPPIAHCDAGCRPNCRAPCGAQQGTERWPYHPRGVRAQGEDDQHGKGPARRGPPCVTSFSQKKKKNPPRCFFFSKCPPGHSKQIFEKFDVDHSGHLDIGEFTALVSTLGGAMTKAEIDAAFHSLDSGTGTPSHHRC